MHKKYHDILNYTMHTNMSMLEEWRQTQASTETLTTLTYPILETLNSSLFGFTFMQLITWTLGMITS